MKSFKILNSNDWLNLTVAHYEKLTQRKYPYYQDIEGKIRHFAICPACNNPIQIINLYTGKQVDYNQRVVPLYARHYSKGVNDLADYDAIKYNNCPLSNPTAFTSQERRIDPIKKNSVIEIINQYPDLIKYFLKLISGMNISKNLFQLILNQFIKEEGYYFLYVNEYNLPYSILYLSDNRNIYGQFLNDKSFIDAINKSKIFFVNSENRIEKRPEITEYAEIRMFFTDYVQSVNENSLSSMKMVITESLNGEDNIMHSKKINIDLEHFVRTLAKKIRENKEEQGGMTKKAP